MGLSQTQPLLLLGAIILCQNFYKEWNLKNGKFHGKGTTFFADGSVQYNFGASTGTNECEGSPNGCEGSCAGDGNTEYLTWTYSEAETEGENDVLTVTRKDTNTEQTTDLVYEILEFGDTQFVGRIDYDLSALFGFEFILTLDETWVAVSKEEKVTTQ